MCLCVRRKLFPFHLSFPGSASHAALNFPHWRGAKRVIQALDEGLKLGNAMAYHVDSWTFKCEVILKPLLAPDLFPELPWQRAQNCQHARPSSSWRTPRPALSLRLLSLYFAIGNPLLVLLHRFISLPTQSAFAQVQNACRARQTLKISRSGLNQR